MRILISGASGLVGTALAPALRQAGHDVGRLVREKARATGGDVFWNPANGDIDPMVLDGADAVINLSGDSIAEGRWTAAKKQRILDSRVSATTTLAKGLAKLQGKPRTLINASAVGYYGDRGDEMLDETSRAGRGDFLSDVCLAWESATEPAAKSNVRVVIQRFGVILSGQGGALKKMLLPFQLGLGGKIGTGKQYMSWITLDDVVGATLHNLSTPSLAGPVNLVAPEPVTNQDFTKTLGKVLGRPTIFPMPAAAARLVFGQMADELLLGGQRVFPTVLENTGYQFKHRKLEDALRHLLGK